MKLVLPSMQKLFLPFLLFFILQKSFAQQPERYKDDVVQNYSVATVVYGNNLNYLNEQDTLHADIYTPSGDSVTKNAMVVFMHGGGFMNGHRFDPAIQEFCRKLVKKGYVIASVDYRLGFEKFNAKGLVNAVIRSVQDLNAFIRYAKANADSLNIDTNKIFIAGASAGGIAVLAKAYMKMDSIFTQSGMSNISELEGNTNNLSNTTSVAGVYSMWGAVLDTNWIQKGDVPVGCIHSIADSTVPFISGPFRKNAALILYGSYSIYTRAVNEGIFTTLHTYDSHEHDLGLKVVPYKDSTVTFMSNFFYDIMKRKP